MNISMIFPFYNEEKTIGLTINSLRHQTMKANEIIFIKDISMIYVFILILFVFLLNLTNQLYMGDSGSYLLGFSFSIFLITIYKFNQDISPFFIILLLWYPSYENLFSIIRKNIIKRSPMYPDAKHMHQLIYMQSGFYLLLCCLEDWRSLRSLLYLHLIFGGSKLIIVLILPIYLAHKSIF